MVNIRTFDAMASRYFAFGCSYVFCRWGTVADLISANFDEYHNLANQGGCNMLSYSRLLEIDKLYKLNSETDYVTIGVTGFGRFSLVDEKNHVWITQGDILPFWKEQDVETWSPGHHPKARLFAKELFSYSWGVYQSWIAIKSIKNFLTSKNIKHKIYPSIDNRLFITEYDLSFQTLELIDDIYKIYDTMETLDDFCIGNTPVLFGDGVSDNHPTQKNHYEYLKNNFPEFDTEKTQKRFELLESLFDISDSKRQFFDFAMKFQKVYMEPRRIWNP